MRRQRGLRRGPHTLQQRERVPADNQWVVLPWIQRKEEGKKSLEEKKSGTEENAKQAGPKKKNRTRVGGKAGVN